MKKLTNGLLALTFVVIILLVTPFTKADTEAVVLSVDFATAIAITEVTNLDFGTIDTGLAITETLIMPTDGGAFTGTGTASAIGAAHNAATFTIVNTTGLSINILVNNITAGTYYTLGTWMATYNGGGDNACDGGGYDVTSVASGATIEVAATLTGLGGAAAGSDDGSFDLVVTYN